MPCNVTSMVQPPDTVVFQETVSCKGSSILAANPVKFEPATVSEAP